MGKEKKYNSILANRFKEIRKENRLTQLELAEILNCTDQYISDMENQKSEIKPNIARLMEYFFSVDSNYLLDENAEHKSKLDELRASLQRTKKHNALKLQIVSSLAELNGYIVEINEPKNNRKITIDEPMTDEEVDEVIELYKEYLLFKKNNKVKFALSIFDAYNLGDNLSELFMANIKLYLDTKKEYKGW